MKFKRWLVRTLIALKIDWLAYRISPSLSWQYKYKEFGKGFRDGFEKGFKGGK